MYNAFVVVDEHEDQGLGLLLAWLEKAPAKVDLLDRRVCFQMYKNSSFTVNTSSQLRCAAERNPTTRLLQLKACRGAGE
jgi:hypothetical protein